MNSRHRSIVLFLVVAVTVLAVGWHLAHPGHAHAEPVAPEPVRARDSIRYPPGAAQLAHLLIQPVHALPAPVMDAQPGKIAFDEDHTVRVVSPGNGRITQLVAEPGTKVKAGDVLAWMDSPDYAQALADARKAHAAQALKAKALDRTRELEHLGVAAGKDLEAAEDDAAEARAESQRADAVLRRFDMAGGQGDRFALRAPITGTVIDRTVNPGLEVQAGAGAPLFVISDTDRLWASFELPEASAGLVHAGQRVRVEVDALPGEPFNGHIRYVGGALDPATRRFLVRVALDHADPRLKPEMFARIAPIDDTQRPMVAVPNAALVNIGMHHYVFVETQAGVLTRREVGIGVGGESVSFLTTGVNDGDRVVTQGAVLLNGELAD